MKRGAIIIANPGEVGTEDYCKGVLEDVEDYQNFLRAAHGGLWENSEIYMPLIKPSVSEVLKAIDSLKKCDYSLIIYSGHGYLSKNDSSTILVLSKGEELDSSRLRNLSNKQTIILDCCRCVAVSPILDEAIIKTAAVLAKLNPQDCQRYYNDRIEKCKDHLLVLHSCKAGEYSYDSNHRGGCFSNHLLHTANDWVQKKRNDVDISKKYSIHSVVEAFSDSEIKVHAETGNRQHPEIFKPRSAPYFPFAVVA